MSKQNNSWIFLRGLSREARHWDTFKPHFEKLLQANVTCVDFPGVGEYFREKSPINIGAIVDHVQQHMPLQGNGHWMLAHSMGCLVGLEWMKREPARFKGAVFTNTSLGRFSSIFERLRIGSLISFFRFMMQSSYSQTREEIKFALTCNNMEKRASTIRLWMDIQRSRPVKTMTWVHQLMAAAQDRGYQKPSPPVLLLNSSGDRLVDPICSNKISKAWGASLQTHPWGGHDIFHDDETWCVETIRKWFESQTTST